MTGTEKGLSNLQQELLRVYSFEISDEDVMELRRFLVRHFGEKAERLAGEIWNHKKLNQEEMEKWLHGDS